MQELLFIRKLGQGEPVDGSGSPKNQISGSDDSDSDLDDDDAVSAGAASHGVGTRALAETARPLFEYLSPDRLLKTAFGASSSSLSLTVSDGVDGVVSLAMYVILEDFIRSGLLASAGVETSGQQSPNSRAVNGEAGLDTSFVAGKTPIA